MGGDSLNNQYKRLTESKNKIARENLLRKALSDNWETIFSNRLAKADKELVLRDIRRIEKELGIEPQPYNRKSR